MQRYASGFLPTPPHDDAVASGSELAPPLPPGDFHPQSIAHAGRTQAPPTAAQWTCRWGGRRLARASGPATLRAALAGRARSRPLAVAAHLVKSLVKPRCGVRIGVLSFGRIMARSRHDFHLVGRDGELALLAGQSGAQITPAYRMPRDPRWAQRPGQVLVTPLHEG